MTLEELFSNLEKLGDFRVSIDKRGRNVEVRIYTFRHGPDPKPGERRKRVKDPIVKATHRLLPAAILAAWEETDEHFAEEARNGG